MNHLKIIEGGRRHWENSLKIYQFLNACKFGFFLVWPNGFYRVKRQKISTGQTSLNATRWWIVIA